MGDTVTIDELVDVSNGGIRITHAYGAQGAGQTPNNNGFVHGLNINSL
jgi:hypothetical protein